jgi:hypothetical protein
MGIKVLHSIGKPTQVILDLNLFLSIVVPEKLKEVKDYQSLLESFQQEISVSQSEDPKDFDNFENWMQALYKLDGRDSNEILLDYGMTIFEFRKQIWDAEKNVIDLISFRDFKKKWQKKTVK